MEQWRWMPEDLGSIYVTANVPEFMLRVVKDGKVIHAERMIAGMPDTQTPVFSAEMETVTFHPQWGVPNSIKVKEILPGLLRGESMLAANGLKTAYSGREVDADADRLDPGRHPQSTSIQPPGPSNVLGVVKFPFPNKHDVYMHDTPTKSLFNAASRTFSHGCMRVRDPLKLAEIIWGRTRAGRPSAWRPLAGAASRQTTRCGCTQDPRARDLLHRQSWTTTARSTFFRDIYGHEKLHPDGPGRQGAPDRQEEGGPQRGARRGCRAPRRISRPGYQNRDWFSQLFGGF